VISVIHKIDHFSCILQLVEAGRKARGGAVEMGVSDKDGGATVRRNFAADLLQMVGRVTIESIVDCRSGRTHGGGER
jgi:hypothetical protein